MWFNFDCCGMVCASITHALLVYAQYVVTYVILLPWFEMSVEGMVHQTIFTAFIFLGQWSHLRAMTTDPGKVPHNAVPGEHVSLNTLSVQRASVGFRGASSRSAGSQRLARSASRRLRVLYVLVSRAAGPLGCRRALAQLPNVRAPPMRWQLQTAAITSLLHLPWVHLPYGSPLPVG